MEANETVILLAEDEAVVRNLGRSSIRRLPLWASLRSFPATPDILPILLLQMAGERDLEIDRAALEAVEERKDLPPVASRGRARYSGGNHHLKRPHAGR
jgi:hypothetical protein